MFKKLSDAEMLIMEELWIVGAPISAKELSQRLYSKNIDWKIQTISTFLTRMELKNFIKSSKCGRSKVYYSIIPKEKILTLEANGLLENYYDGSIKKFLVALSSGRISNEKAEELEKWLYNQKEDIE